MARRIVRRAPAKCGALQTFDQGRLNLKRPIRQLPVSNANAMKAAVFAS